MTAIKFCGLTRVEDVAYAVELGAAYVGVVFAGGPRMLTVERAAQVLSVVPRGGPKRVGVFGAESPDRLSKVVKGVPLDAVQLHQHRHDDGIAIASDVRARVGGAVWVVLRCAEGRLPRDAATLIQGADAILLDAAVPGRLGGAGVTLPWERMVDEIAELRDTRPIILAGGLTPDNVARAIAVLRPQVVDVSSGVEREPGVKDHARMRAFVDAVQGADRSMTT